MGSAAFLRPQDEVASHGDPGVVDEQIHSTIKQEVVSAARIQRKTCLTSPEGKTSC